ncbi:MAG: glucoamylase family protein [Coriobacteriia bacterium]
MPGSRRRRRRKRPDGRGVAVDFAPSSANALLTIDQLEDLARELARAQKYSTAPGPRRTPVLDLVEHAEDVLVSFHSEMSAAVRERKAVPPATEWLLDNNYLVEEQFLRVRRDLPKGFGRELPHLVDGPFVSYPRVFEAATALVRHTDARLDEDYLYRFIRAYQEHSPLTIGETWAVPIMLRVALVANLGALASLVRTSYAADSGADEIADALLDIRSGAALDVRDILHRMDLGHKRHGTRFLLRLQQRLRDRDLVPQVVSEWLDARLADLPAGVEAARNAELHLQASQQVSIANSITSIRFVNALDWRRFFEKVNRVEAVLREDPAGIYDRMDFTSRDRYRDAVESLSRRCPASEEEVARAAVEAAREGAKSHPDDPARAHVGWYLIRGGRYEFENGLRYRPRPRERVYRGPLRRGGYVFWGLILIFTVGLLALVATHALSRNTPVIGVALLCLLAFFPLSEIAVTIANRIAVAVWPARPLPALDYRLRLTDSQRTLVTVVALVRSPQEARDLVSRIEVNYLTGAQDPNVHFALVCEPQAADSETLPDDEEILEAAREAIAELNDTHGPRSVRPFHLFARRRVFHPTEDEWLGWERKRGALLELCRLIRGEETTFVVHEGDEDFLRGVRYVLTLDADTMLPRDGVRRLVSVIHHPLNRPVIDPESRRVVRGYGVVQPRVTHSLTSAERTLYSWMHTGTQGIDPYGGVVSDVYQDVFGEGSFTGKAIFDADAYLEVLEDRFPEGRILSHDLIEGNYLRCGLATDIEVFDDFPSTYPAATRRQHRWTRGDWQLLPWLFPRVPSAKGPQRNVLTALHRWKIADNLRRSLVPPSLMAMIVFGWAVLPGPDAWWLGLIVFLTFFPAFLQFADSMMSHPKGVPSRRAMRAILGDFRRDLYRAVFELATLPHQAWVQLDAIVRSLWRQAVSHKKLLEWMTAAEAEALSDPSRTGHLRSMGPPVALAVAGAIPATVLVPDRIWFALPILALWVASPLIAYHSNRPLIPQDLPLSPDDLRYLRSVARRTWRFFETFVGPEDNWLIPDNFQEDPGGVVAHRTSPTNIGLQILSYATAYDMGYITLPSLVDLSVNTLTTLVSLPRFRGHFFNWYDTKTREPLPPGYVSTVDSGNLCGHLIAFGQALDEALEAPFFGPSVLRGLADTTRVAIEDAADALERHPEKKNSLEALRALLDLILESQVPRTLPGWLKTLRNLESQAAMTIPRIVEVLDDDAAIDSVESILRDVRRCMSDLDTYVPWCHTALKLPEGLSLADLPEQVRPFLEGTPSAQELADVSDAVDALSAFAETLDGEPAEWCRKLADGLAAGASRVEPLLTQGRLARQIARETWMNTDFRVVYDADRKLFSIGFNTAEGRKDPSYYDMLASECRLASFIAVAKGDVPQSHWFRLGRAITTTSDGYALLSWSASMFEYLMPLLVMDTWPGTILDETYRTVVRRQIEYGRQQRVPWGISESAFAAQDAQGTYQYRAFGVPGLGLKRGLLDDVVVAPYATILALPLEPGAAVANLRALEARAAKGRFGFYEAIDYTPGRIPAGQERAVIKAYMAHHQGMSLVSLGNLLAHRSMCERFHEDPVVRSAEMLLQERAPRHVEVEHPNVEEVEYVRSVRELMQPHARSYPTPHTPVPATHFLSNGSYSVMVTNAGGGYSRWRDVDVSRYREDVTRDCWGTFLYVRDADTGDFWSAAFQPTLVEPDEYHVTFSEEKAEFRRHDGAIETHTEVVVSPEHDVEIRRISLTNHDRKPRTLEVTSYLEASLAPNAADQAHRTFSNLFVETEAAFADDVLLFTRRPRSADEKRLWGFHALACETQAECAPTFETDRARFLGRLRQPFDPAAMHDEGELSCTAGPVLDPICSLRQRVTLEPGETARLAFSTGVAEDKVEALSLAAAYRDIRAAQRALDLAWTSSQIVLRDLGITPEEAVVYQRLASRLLLTDPYSPLKVLTPVENGLPISALWSLGISGDNPILLVRIERLEETPLVRQALLAHQYWRHAGLISDLVILNTQPSAYSSELQERLHLLIRTGHALGLLDRPGGVFLRSADQMSPDVRNLLETVARAVVDGDRGSLLLQLNQRANRPELPLELVPRSEPGPEEPLELPRPDLADDNGFGGFDPKTDEYVVVVDDRPTPAPWVNVMANAGGLGCMVTEAGIGCTWAINSHENRLTTWNNDPVSDGSGEAVYLRDEATGEVWSPTLLPTLDPGTHIARHGHGYTIFEHHSHGIRQELTVFVPPSEPARVARVRLTNDSGRTREISVYQYVEWAIGPSRSAAQQRVVTWYDQEGDLLTAHNHYNEDFPGRTAFLTADRPIESYTASRTEFLGRNGSPRAPEALRRTRLGAQAGRFHDAAGVLQVRLTLEPGESATAHFFLGQTDDLQQARELVARLRAPDAVGSLLDETRRYWRDLLDTLAVSTPDPVVNRLASGWLLYQAIACRLWGRTALYQSSGAIGFRDQLQDSLALLLVEPEMVRERILDAAAHQFPEGDVMHWWMPVSNRGVRTRITDDRHWLAYVTAEYVEATGDLSVLDEVVPYVEGQPLEEHEEDRYFEPGQPTTSGTVLEHCMAAFDSVRLGEHGLPLMGGGDWNDGMNRVGRLGRGESVWLGWFLEVTCRKFADVCEAKGEGELAADLRKRADSLLSAIEAHAWDGDWYVRAFFDDGTPLGTSRAEECRIDAIAQAWAAISGRGDPERVRKALASVREHLVDEEAGLVLLLTPPFDRTEKDPGYIKGYVPGVRENGGQYTHAACWVALAHLEAGDVDGALEILRMLDPASHSTDRESASRYAVEPYVVAADVYSNPAHLGRGGWTWYTGSAGWLYRTVVWFMLGIQRAHVDGRPALRLRPRLPSGWEGFEATYRFGEARYDIEVRRATSPVHSPGPRLTLDGRPVEGDAVPLDPGQGRHSILVEV